jgi:hypothetical protein
VANKWRSENANTRDAGGRYEEAKASKSFNVKPHKYKKAECHWAGDSRLYFLKTKHLLCLYFSDRHTIIEPVLKYSSTQRVVSFQHFFRYLGSKKVLSLISDLWVKLLLTRT